MHFIDRNRGFETQAQLWLECSLTNKSSSFDFSSIYYHKRSIMGIQCKNALPGRLIRHILASLSFV